MHKKFTTIAILTTALLGSCTKQQSSNEVKVVPVGFYAQGGTKVNIDAPSGVMEWEGDDIICLWACKDDGSEALSAVEFTNVRTTEHPNMSYFTATLPQKMDEEKYDYNCWTPKPLSHSKEYVMYQLPEIQKGTNYPVILYGRGQAGPLTSVEEDAIHFTMTSLLHYIRFSLKEGSELLGEPVKKIKFTMPEAIAGTLNFQMKGGELESLAGESNTIVITDCPKDYALAAIVPPSVSYSQGDYMVVKIYGEEKFAELKPFHLKNRDFKAGHITSVSLKNGDIKDFYSLSFSLKENLLGENLQKITLTLSDKSLWPGTNSSTLSWSPEPEADNFSISFEEKSEYDLLNGKEVMVNYESENALVSETLVLNISATRKKTEIGLRCPYLMYEDFTMADIGFNINGNLNATGHEASTLEGSSYGLSGWTACQAAIVQGEDGNKSLAIRHQNETYWLQGTYRGRVDSAPLASIKSGKSVKVKVTFNYTGYSNGSTTPMLSYGYGEQQGALVGYYQGGSAAIQGGELIEHIEGDKVSAPKDGSASSINESAEFEIASCTTLTRLGWDCYGSKGKNSTTQEWVFIDNIKVQIVK